MTDLHPVTDGPATRQTAWALNTVLLLPLTLIAMGATLRVAESVLLPLVFAWLLAGLLAPLVNALTRLRVPHWIAIILVLMLTVMLFFQVGSFMHARMTAFASKYGEYARKMAQLTQHFRAQLPDEAARMLGEFDWQSRLGHEVVTFSRKLVSFSSNFMLVMVVVLFLLVGRPFFGRKLTAAFSPADADRIANVLEGIAAKVSRYLLLQFLISTVTGLMVWWSLEIIGIDFAPSWGAMAFVLNFIPIIGSIVASTPPILIALVQYAPESYWPAIITGVSLLTIQTGIGNVIAPRVLGDHLNLSPVTVLIALLFWGWIWGAPGALLAVPIMSAIKIVCDNVAPLHPLGIMLGSGRHLS